MGSPYTDLDRRSYWKLGVTEDDLQFRDIWRPRFKIRKSDQIMTAGSCFAQHISRYLRASGYAVLDAEPAPPGLSQANAAKFGYSIYSGRYGNIYTVRHLLQLTKEVLSGYQPADAIWKKGDRFVDAMRPNVEPNGLGSSELVTKHRRAHLAAFRGLLENADIVVLTLGLTETWVHRASGTVYPMAPGTIAGSYDPTIHEFVNLTVSDIVVDFKAFRSLVKEINARCAFLLTVSPVPLTATASGQHVLAATTYSKSVLRAAAGELKASLPDVDYFPSYEIVTGIPSRGQFFEQNARSVTERGVSSVMRVFLGSLGAGTEDSSFAAKAAMAQDVRSDSEGGGAESVDVVCEEVLLDAFAG